jgi:hypothetical protein
MFAFSGNPKVLRPLDKQVESDFRTALDFFVRAFAEHPPEVVEIMEEEPFDRLCAILPETDTICHLRFEDDRTGLSLAAMPGFAQIMASAPGRTELLAEWRCN